MIHRNKKDFGLVWSIACSLLLHASFLAGLVLFGSFLQVNPTVAPVYYVDILNLPVENPRAGSPAAEGDDEGASPPKGSEKQEMRLPPDKPSAAGQKNKAKELRPEMDREFQERLARLERKVGDRQTDAAIEALRRKAAAGGLAGMPGGTGTEAGSDYGSYLQSRLKDAFAITIASRTPNPLVVVRLTIDRSGRVVGLRIERSTGDRVFEESVNRAVERASEHFPPPPGQREFQQGFIFKPEGVGIK